MTHRSWPVAFACLLSISVMPMAAAAETPQQEVARRACGTLASRVAAIPGDGPVFLRSYDDASGNGVGTEPALGGAFTYDNALAAIALQACGEGDAARRVGAALLAAMNNDRLALGGGRLRNAYRPGPVSATFVPPMGWWNAQDGRWVEDAYQTGTATGNVAWAALALLTLAEATQDEDYLNGAARLADWVIATTYNARPPAGFNGGIYGYDDQPERQTWKSTEHNTDMAAVFDWLQRSRADDKWPQEKWPGEKWSGNAEIARNFVAAQWDASSGHFWVGTTPDGSTTNRGNAGLDAQLWPLLLWQAPASWRSSMDHAEQAHGVMRGNDRVGFDFNDDRDGVWWEGTAQTALVYQVLGRIQDAAPLFAGLTKQFSPGGMIWATDSPRITTGFALSPSSTTDDFYYFRLPHLGATAWAAIAAIGWNPLTGQVISRKP